jgi:putative CocE/NonD family hydrolase
MGGRTDTAPKAMKRYALMIALVWLALACAHATAQDFEFEPPADADAPELQAAIRDLAERVLPGYAEDDPDRYFATLAALQMSVGDPAAAHTTRLTLRDRLQTEGSASPPGRTVVYDVYTQARAIEAAEGIPFADAYRRAFEETFAGVDDLTAYELERWFTAPVEPQRAALQRALDTRRGTTSIALEDAVELLQAWLAFDVYRSSAAVVNSLIAADSERRYVVEELAIPVAEGVTIAAALVRPRAAADGALPALLEFTLDRDSRDPREAAAHGYASVLALARIAGDPAFRPRAPFETDGDDARAVIDWIAAQPWSDGRAGMQGIGYGGFVAWSAAKRLPAALHAIATIDPMAPGIDVPSVNRIVHNAAYRWVYRLLAPPGDETADDETRWRALDDSWYRSGRSYREFPVLPGRASLIFRSWLNHPSYDRFWQKWLPFAEEFSSVGLPVLTVTGFYSAGETGALYYFSEHHAHAASADHTLLIGPFNEQSVEHGAASAVGGLSLDMAARIDAGTVRYEWLAHALRGAERPALLGGVVNYQLAGAEEWRQAPSLVALESEARRFYFAASPTGAPHRLRAQAPVAAMSLTDIADLGDRDEVGWQPTREVVLREIHPRNGTLFMTEPFAEHVDIAGRFRGELDFTINKYDVDLVMMLYELKPDGEYVKLFDPAYAFRSSYARDRSNRRLLTAGVRQQLPFQSERMVGRRLTAGSRLVLAVGINKRVDQQINYGAGGEVSEESIDDAGAPVRIRWHEGSFVEIPVQPPLPIDSRAQ